MTRPKVRPCPSCQTPNQANRKTCSFCFKSLSTKRTFKNKVQSLDSQWAQAVIKNRNTGRIIDSACIAVQKLDAIGSRPILFLGKQDKVSNKWVADVITNLEPTSTTRHLLEKMKTAYEFLLTMGCPITVQQDTSTSQQDVINNQAETVIEEQSEVVEEAHHVDQKPWKLIEEAAEMLSQEHTKVLPDNPEDNIFVLHHTPVSPPVIQSSLKKKRQRSTSPKPSTTFQPSVAPTDQPSPQSPPADHAIPQSLSQDGQNETERRKNVQQVVLIKQEAPEEQSAGMQQWDPEHLCVKEEREELWTSLEEEQLHLKNETDDTRFPFTIVYVKSEDDEEKPLFSQLHQQQQIEDRGIPTSSSAEQMTIETSGGAQTTRKPDLNLDEQASDSSETEVSGDDEGDDGDVILDSKLSDSEPETGYGNNDWNESRSSESDVKTVYKSFSCLECGEQFLNKVSLRKHVRVTGHSALRSSGSSTNNKCVKLKQHVDPCMKVQQQPKSFICDECGKRFGRKLHLTEHMTVHTGQKPFTCEICEHRFSRKTSLNRHMSVHTEQKPFACELCGQRFSQKTNLNSHMSVHTGQKPFACKLCGQRFSQNRNLKCHMSVHTGQKPFACEICEHIFSRKASLNRHLSIHTGQKPFACEFCGQRFNQKAILNSHISVHTGHKPFSCEVCGQRFNRKAILNCHMSVHTGQKPFACELCGKRFSLSRNFKCHMSAHAGQKPFACEICGHRFSRKGNLNRHLSVHTEQKKPV
ncbi:zinc finger protein 16 [Nothobranchius furzeri]|uniref:Transcript variant X1 n=1 Tax=Nothobranchius furzeri TaxID=105023 RepID=A0A9D3BEI0_NOTFU|nr:transcript variant X4 [Nothobranchius furzeri]KAF7204203.1 transcript variant X2 [Nothobranchius furzeri]KAF7204204.1 transcript variant X1 [Nothobranchius furzeri]KAF7204205.1 transcript variant X3 [Nothobranchius furzeri]